MHTPMCPEKNKFNFLSLLHIRREDFYDFLPIRKFMSASSERGKGEIAFLILAYNLAKAMIAL